MKNGSIVRVTINYSNCQDTFLAIIADQEADFTTFILETNQEQRVKNSMIAKMNSVRGLSEQTRNICKFRYEMYQNCKKYLQKIADLQKEVSLFRTMSSNFPQQLAKSMGCLTLQEFVEELRNHFSKEILDALEAYEYNIEYSAYGARYSIDFIRTVYIQKHFREASFLYREYDGTMQFTDDCEQDRTYQKYIKMYERKIPFKHMDFSSSLGIGDKDWLSYCGRYRLDIPKEPLTKELAAKLAKKICA